MLTEKEHQKRREFLFTQLACRTIDDPRDPPEWPSVADMQANPEAARARIYAWYDAMQRAESQKEQEKPLEPHLNNARKAVFDFIRKNGLPKPGLRDGKQTKLENLIAQSFKDSGVRIPVKSTIQRYRKRFVEEFKALKAEAD